MSNTNTEELSQGLLARYLCFSIGEEEFAIPLLDVKEVIAMPDITPVPYTPAHFLGIMNLRGHVISIIDLRNKFKIKPRENAETSVVICDFNGLQIGVVVDSVNTVLSPKPSEMAPKPEIQSQVSTEYITGIITKEKRLIIMLDVAKTLGAEDYAAANKMVRKAA